MAVRPLLAVEEPDFPLPQVNGSAGVQEFLLSAQLEILQRFGVRSPAGAILDERARHIAKRYYGKSRGKRG